MSTDLLLLSYILMLFLQTLHNFEEIGFEADELVGSLVGFDWAKARWRASRL
jgi:hypothetical protein